MSRVIIQVTLTLAQDNEGERFLLLDRASQCLQAAANAALLKSCPSLTGKPWRAAFDRELDCCGTLELALRKAETKNAMVELTIQG
jgi:hypothetical protein